MSYPTSQVSLIFSFLSVALTSITLNAIALWIPLNRINIRWKLVINLLCAQLLNAANNSVSGLFYSFDMLTKGPACTANGFIGQLTVQASDLTTLAIAIVTFMTLRSTSLTSMTNKLETQIYWILCLVWIIPLMTSLIGLYTVGYEYTSGNWCWLAPVPAARYGLTHGPRILIFFIIVVLYSIIGYNLMVMADKSRENIEILSNESQNDAKLTKKKIYNATVRLMSVPIVYIILWAPGMVNRLFEALGEKNSLSIFLQSFTQLLGFADSLLALWNLWVIKKDSF